MGDWTTISTPGGGTGTSVPDAPNVLDTTTAVVSYVDQDGNASDSGGFFVVGGTVYLPTTDVNYTRLRMILVRVTVSGGTSKVVDILKAPFAGNTQAWQSFLLPRPTQDAAIDLVEFLALNDNSVTAPSPFTISSLAVVGMSPAPEQAQSIALVEVANSRIPGELPGRTTTKLRAVLQLSGVGVMPDRGEVRLYDSTDAERYGVIGGQIFPITFPVGDDPYIEFPAYAPTINEVWYVKVSLASASSANAWATAVASSNLSISGLGLPAADEITNLTISAGSGGNFPYNAISPDKTQYWLIPSAAYDDTNCVSDPNAFFVRVTVTACDASHNPCGPEQSWAGTQVSEHGGLYDCGGLMGNYGTTGYGTTFSANIAYVRFKVYVCNRVDQTLNAWANPACATLQTGVGNGAGYVDKMVAASGAVPAGLLDAGRMTTGWGSGLIYDAGTGKPRIYYGPGMGDDGSGRAVPKLDTPLAVLNDKITVANQGITNQYLGVSAVAAANMQANAVTQANGALAVNAVVDANVANVGLAKLIFGTAIFVGNAYFSRGSGYPIMALTASGMYLYAAAASGGGDGLTNHPYVAVEYNQIGLFSGGNESLTMSASSLTLWSVNGNSGYPYLNLTWNNGIILNNGSFNATVTANQISLSYLYGGSTVLNAAGVKVLNGTYSVHVTSQYVRLYSVDGSTSSPYIEVSSTSGLMLRNGDYALVATASSLYLAYGSGAATVVQSDGVYIYLVKDNTSYPYLKITSSGFFQINGSHTVNISSDSLSTSYGAFLRFYTTATSDGTTMGLRANVSSGIFVSSTITDQFIHIFGGSHDIVITGASGLYAASSILIDGNKVLGARQTGLGSPSGWSTVSDALSWCQALYTRLSTGGHGLVT